MFGLSTEMITKGKLATIKNLNAALCQSEFELDSL